MAHNGVGKSHLIRLLAGDTSVNYTGTFTLFEPFGLKSLHFFQT